MGFSKGDRVAWNTAQGTTHGTVQSKHTEDLEFKGQTFRAEDDDPVYVVKSEKSGSEAAHKESALTAAKNGSDDDGGSGKGSGSGKSNSGKGGGEHHPTKKVQEAAQRAVKWIEEGKAGKGFTDTGAHRAHLLCHADSAGHGGPLGRHAGRGSRRAPPIGCVRRGVARPLRRGHARQHRRRGHRWWVRPRV